MYIYYLVVRTDLARRGEKVIAPSTVDEYISVEVDCVYFQTVGRYAVEHYIAVVAAVFDGAAKR